MFTDLFTYLFIDSNSIGKKSLQINNSTNCKSISLKNTVNFNRINSLYTELKKNIWWQ